MAEFEEKLSAILANPQAMGQILSIAKSITGEGEPPPEEAPPPSEPPSEGGLSGLLDGLSQGENPLATLGDLDPRMLQIGLTLFSEYSTTDNRKIALLQALKPFLAEKRLAKVDKAIQIAKLSRVVATAYRLFKEDGGGGDV